MILQHPGSVGRPTALPDVHRTHQHKHMLSAKHLVSGRSNSKVYFLGKYSNIHGKALFHDGDHVTFMA